MFSSKDKREIRVYARVYFSCAPSEAGKQPQYWQYENAEFVLKNSVHTEKEEEPKTRERMAVILEYAFSRNIFLNLSFDSFTKCY